MPPGWPGCLPPLLLRRAFSLLHAGYTAAFSCDMIAAGSGRAGDFLRVAALARPPERLFGFSQLSSGFFATLFMLAAAAARRQPLTFSFIPRFLRRCRHAEARLLLVFLRR